MQKSFLIGLILLFFREDDVLHEAPIILPFAFAAFAVTRAEHCTISYLTRFPDKFQSFGRLQFILKIDLEGFSYITLVENIRSRPFGFLSGVRQAA